MPQRLTLRLIDAADTLPRRPRFSLRADTMPRCSCFIDACHSRRRRHAAADAAAMLYRTLLSISSPLTTRSAVFAVTRRVCYAFCAAGAHAHTPAHDAYCAMLMFSDAVTRFRELCARDAAACHALFTRCCRFASPLR